MKDLLLSPLPEGQVNYSVTGEHHGAIVAAKSEYEARSIFELNYPNEKILSVHIHGHLPASAVILTH